MAFEIMGMTPELVLLIVGGLVSLGIIFVYGMNQLYPTINFLVFKGSMFYIEKRRLLGEVIVPDNIVQILMKGKGNSVESIKQFGDPFYLIKPKLFLFKDTVKIYLASKGGDTLLPMAVENKELKFGDLLAAKELAGMWISSQRMAEDDTTKKQPVMAAIVMVLPIGIVLLLFALILYVMINSFITASEKVLVVAEKIIERVENMESKLAPSNPNTITLRGYEYAKTDYYNSIKTYA